MVSRPGRRPCGRLSGRNAMNREQYACGHYIQQNVPMREDFGESGEEDGASVPGESQRNTHSQGFSNTKHSGKCVMSAALPGPLRWKSSVLPWALE